MRYKILYLALSVFLILMFAGCSGNQNITNSDNDENIKNVVWDYVQSEGISGSKFDWRRAKVEKRIVESQFLDEKYQGKKIYTVTLEDAVSSPLIMVDPENNKVIGFLPGE